MASTINHELQRANNRQPASNLRPDQTDLVFEQADSFPGTEIRSLPTTDHGRQAYLILLGCTLIQAPIWGYSLAFGVFQEYYTTHNVIKGPARSIAIVGTTLNGTMYLMMPASFTLLTRYPRFRPLCGPIGLAITAGSLILSSYATHVWQLIASQGVLCAIGCGLLFSPTTLYLDEWFKSRKGMAYGTIWAGKSATGVCFPFIMSSLLQRHGARVTLQAWAVCLVILTAPLLFFLKPRIPLSNSRTQRPLSWKFLKHFNFWILQLGNIIQSFGYLLPTTYLASYAHTLGLPPIAGAILIAVYSCSSVPGSLVIGLLGDRLSASTVILIASVGSALAIFLFWGLSRSVTLLVVFAITYGFFAGGFSSTYPGILHQMRREDDSVETGLVMGLLLGGRGLGFMSAGPVSAALLRPGSLNGSWGYNSEYGPVIVYSGATALFGGLGWVWKMLTAVNI